MSRTIEQRLEHIERELAALKGEVKNQKPDPNWINGICGTFKDDPEFDEVLRLGKELRDAEEPEESNASEQSSSRGTSTHRNREC